MRRINLGTTILAFTMGAAALAPMTAMAQDNRHNDRRDNHASDRRDSHNDNRGSRSRDSGYGHDPVWHGSDRHDGNWRDGNYRVGGDWHDGGWHGGGYYRGGYGGGYYYNNNDNTWRDLGILGGAVGIAGLISGNNTLAALGIGGGLYSEYRYDQDRRSDDRYGRDRYELFSHASFDYRGDHYIRRERFRDGQKYFYFERGR